MSRTRGTHAQISTARQLAELGDVALHAADTGDPALVDEAAALALKFGLIRLGPRLDLLAAVLSTRIGEVGDEALADLATRARHELARRETRRRRRHTPEVSHA